MQYVDEARTLDRITELGNTLREARRDREVRKMKEQERQDRLAQDALVNERDLSRLDAELAERRANRELSQFKAKQEIKKSVLAGAQGVIPPSQKTGFVPSTLSSEDQSAVGEHQKNLDEDRFAEIQAAARAQGVEITRPEYDAAVSANRYAERLREAELSNILSQSKQRDADAAASLRPKPTVKPLTPSEKLDMEQSLQTEEDRLRQIEHVGKIVANKAQDVVGPSKSTWLAKGANSVWAGFAPDWLKWGNTDKEYQDRLDVTQFVNDLAMMKTKRLPGPLSEKELAFLRGATISDKDNPEKWARTLSDMAKIQMALIARRKAILSGASQEDAFAVAPDVFGEGLPDVQLDPEVQTPLPGTNRVVIVKNKAEAESQPPGTVVQWVDEEGNVVTATVK